MKNKLTKVLGVAPLVLLLSFPATASAATVKLLTWDLVDSGKHMDWDGSSQYQSSFNAGVNTWNNYKSGVIRKDSISVVQDVAISDYYEKSTTAGVTSSNGTIKFNKYNMDSLSSAQKQNVATHELGHALRLAHNQSTDVMYAYVTSKTTLSTNDKASYDQAYKYNY